MTDLRTRIAAAIYHAASAWDQDWPFDELVDHVRVLYLEQADAVIEELKLRRDTVGLIHRYVTEWEPNEAD